MVHLVVSHLAGALWKCGFCSLVQRGEVGMSIVYFLLFKASPYTASTEVINDHTFADCSAYGIQVDSGEEEPSHADRVHSARLYKLHLHLHLGANGKVYADKVPHHTCFRDVLCGVVRLCSDHHVYQLAIHCGNAKEADALWLPLVWPFVVKVGVGKVRQLQIGASRFRHTKSCARLQSSG